MHSTCLGQAHLYVTPKLAMSVWRVTPLSTPSSHFTSGPLNGKSAYSPQIPDTKLAVTSKVQFLQLQHVFGQKCNEHNPSYVRRHTLPSQSSQLLIIQFHLNTHNLSRVLQHQKQTQYSMLQIKTLSLNTFRLSSSNIFILLLFLTNLARGLTTLSEETTRRKHTYVTPSSSLDTNNTSLSLTTKSTAKKILVKNNR